MVYCDETSYPIFFLLNEYNSMVAYSLYTKSSLYVLTLMVILVLTGIAFKMVSGNQLSCLV